MNDTSSPPSDTEETVVVPLKSPADGDLSTELLIALESELGRGASELPPLSRAIDPALLDALGAPRERSTSFVGRLSFRYAGRQVVVERVNDPGHGSPDIVVTIQSDEEPTARA